MVPISRVVQSLAGRALVVVDLRGLPVLAPKDSAIIEGSVLPPMTREAFLVGQSATRAMQASRLARVGSFENRRVFADAAQLIAWMSEVASDPELSRLRSFLAPVPRVEREAPVEPLRDRRR